MDGQGTSGILLDNLMTYAKSCSKGDRLIIETPGGGAWGKREEGKENESLKPYKHVWAPRGSLAEREAAQAGF
jgi:N-methylhydantoinase B/oxoprolinase/acetone carboxylase alpha subunit